MAAVEVAYVGAPRNSSDPQPQSRCVTWPFLWKMKEAHRAFVNGEGKIYRIKGMLSGTISKCTTCTITVGKDHHNLPPVALPVMLRLHTKQQLRVSFLQRPRSLPPRLRKY